MDQLFDGLFGIVAASWGTTWRASRSFRHPTTWDDGDGSLWTWLAAFGLLLPLVPLGIATGRFSLFALHFADDEMLFMLGILLFVPLAFVALAALGVVAAWGLWTAAALLTGREGGAWLAGGYLALMAMFSMPFFSAGFVAYGWAVLATTFAALLLLMARATAR